MVSFFGTTPHIIPQYQGQCIPMLAAHHGLVAGMIVAASNDTCHFVFFS
jgi:hypothetical protein